jgi:hypothetical protein
MQHILLSGEQTQQLKGRVRQMLGAEVPGAASMTTCSKGAPGPSSTLPETLKSKNPTELLQFSK